MKFLAAAMFLLSLSPAFGVECANGVYRAGCAGPNGAAVIRKQNLPPPPRYAPPSQSRNCASGAYRAGCVGPNGAVIVR